jgi:putative ABC transport system permease protein
VPSIRLMRQDPFQHLKAAGRSGALGRRGGLRRILVVAQVAAAVVIASAAGLLGRTVLALRAVDPGFDPSNVLMVEVNAPRADYPDVAAVRDLYIQILESLEAMPGVESAAASWQTPLQIGMSDWPARTNAEDAEWMGADPNLVTPAYFRTYGIELVEGRLFDRSDLARPDGVVILSETAANRLFPGESAVGRTVNVNFDAPVWREVIGVVRDIRGRGLGQEPRPQTYFTQSSVPFGAIATLTVAVRGRVTAAEFREAATATLRRLDPDVPLGAVTALEDQVSQSVAGERFLAILLGAFAGTALLLGCIGVYGVLAYDVSRRRREIGLRIALGARPGGVLAGVVGGALLLAGIGIGIGIAGALASGRLLEGWLYGVSSADPLHAIAVGAVVLGAALVAGLLPARRAAAVSPLTALREE